MNEIQLKQQILIAIGDDLGTYTTRDGATIPAIWIAPPKVDSSFATEGLECVIQGDPEERSMVTTTGDSLAREYWSVRLIQWNQDKRLYSVKQKIRQHFRQLNMVVTSADIPATDLNYAQCVIKIFDPIWVSQGRAQCQS